MTIDTNTIAPAPDVAALSTKEAWDAAFAAWEAAKVAYDFMDAAYETARAEAGDDNNPDLAKMAAALDERAEAESRTRFALIEMTAPDLLAVQWKLQQLYGPENQEGGTNWRPEYPAAILADVARLQSEIAETWLAAWTADGGAVIIGDDGKLQYSFPTYELSPRYVEPADHMDEQFASSFIQTSGQHYHSTMNARFDVLRMIPGGSDMIKAHMRGNGVSIVAAVMEQGHGG